MLLSASLVLGMVFCLPAVAQEKGIWRASSTTAKGITGDLAFWNEKIVINFAPFVFAQIRTLDGPEVTALFNGEGGSDGVGNLYRLNTIPAAKVFLHKNTLCGHDDTQWFATYVVGKSMQLAFFSGAKMPVFTPEALADSTNLCGTFSYVR